MYLCTSDVKLENWNKNTNYFVIKYMDSGIPCIWW